VTYVQLAAAFHNLIILIIIHSQILKDIDTAVARNQFHVRPLGPLGSLIKITEPKWLKAIEGSCHLATPMRCYCVVAYRLGVMSFGTHSLFGHDDATRLCYERLPR